MAALFSTQCLSDFVAPADLIYEVAAQGALTDSVHVGDTVSLPPVQLKVNGAVMTTAWTASVVAGDDVMKVDSTSRLIVLKLGQATLRVRPLNASITDTSKFVDFTLRGVIARLTVGGPDTAYAIGDTVQPTPVPQSPSGVALTNSGASFTWNVEGSDSAATLLSSVTGAVRAVKNGQIRIRAKSDTASAIRTIVVSQRPASISVADPALLIGGASQTINATARDSRGNAMNAGAMSFTSLNTNVATVNGSGVVTGIGSGQATIAVNAGGVTTYVLATVNVHDATPAGWFGQLETIHTLEMSAMWGTSASNVFAGGNGGNMRRFDGSTWSQMTSNTSATFWGLWGSSADNIFAAGAAVRFDGTNWVTAGAIPSGSFGVWGSSPRDAWAVGSGTGMFRRFDGSTWNTVTSTVGSHTLRRVWGSSPANVWAVGEGGVIVRYNGTSWAQVQSGMTADLLGLWGSSANDIYAVGGSGAGVALHYDGSSWNPVSMPAAAQTALQQAGHVYGVWGSSPSDVYIAGGSTILHYNGTTWTVLNPDLTGIGTPGFFPRSIWGTSSGDVFVADWRGRVIRGKRIASITISPSTATLTAVDATIQLTANALDASNAQQGAVTFSWTTSDSGVATVSGSGQVTAKGHGTANVCASIPGGVQGCRTVTVNLPNVVASVSLNTNSFIMGSGTTTLTATAKNASGNVIADAPITWASENPSVATVSSSGVVTAVSTGQATITASASTGVSASALITVSTAGATPANQWTPASSGTNANLTAVWGQGSRAHAVAGEPAGAFLRLDAGSWTTLSVASPALNGLWGSPVGNALAVGVAGRLMRWNGTSWTESSSGTSTSLFAVWASSHNDLFAVGDGGLIRHFNGSQWTTMSAPTTTKLNGVYGFARSDVYAVGGNGTILRFNGTSWTLMTSGTGAELRAIWGASPSHIFAVGINGTLLKYDGSGWNSIPTGTSSAFNAVWGTSETDVYIGAHGGMWHYDGTALSFADFPSLELNAVWGTSTGNVYAVGNGGTILRGSRGVSVSSVAVTPPTQMTVGATQQLAAVARDANNAVMTGVPFKWSGSANTVATVSASGVVTAVSNGTLTVCAQAVGGPQGCAQLTVGPVAASIAISPGSGTITSMSSSQTFDAVVKDASGATISGASVIWASLNPNVVVFNSSSAGIASPVASGQAVVSATSGSVTDYALVTVSDPEKPAVNLWMPVSSGTSHALFTAWGTSASNVFSAGIPGTIVSYNGTSWTTVATGSSPHVLRRMWGASSNNVWAVGGGGTVAHWNDTIWDFSNPVVGEWSGVWGAAPNDVYAVGGGGIIMRYNGSSWSSMTSPTTQNLRGVWGSSRFNIFAVGDGGTILRYDGASWSTMTSPTTQTLLQVWGTSSSNVVAVGLHGTILRFTGTSWSAEASTTTETLTDVWASSATHAYAVGYNGTILLSNVSGGWTAMTTGVTGTLEGIFGTSSDVWVPASPGTMLRGVRGATMTVSPNAPVLAAIGHTSNMEAVAKDAAGAVLSGVAFNWTSSSPNVASVITTGVVTAIANGTTNVCATAPGGAQGCQTVTVSQTVAEVGLAPNNALSPATAFTATARDANGNAIAGKTFTWSSLNPSVAVVDASGVVTPVASGQATIAATVDGVTGYTFVTVSQDVTPAVNLWVPQASGTTKGIQGVWAASATDIFAVAGNGGEILRYNGTAWSVMTIPTSGISIVGVWGTSSSDVYAVGASGTILRFNGTSWSAMTSGTTETLTAVWGTSPRDIFAVGLAGTILRFDGSAWTPMASNTTQELRAVWGHATGGLVIAAAANGEIFQYDGTSWSAASTGTLMSMSGGLWGRQSNDIWIAGGSGSVKRFDGANWTQSSTSTTEHLTGIWGGSASDVYATGANGAIVRFDGTNWTTMTSGVSVLLWRVLGFGSHVVVVGNSGTILHGYRGAAVVVSPAATIYGLGNSQQITASAKDATNNTIGGVTFTWSSSSPSTATVSSSGLVTAVAVGTTNVCATASGGAEACTAIEVAELIHSDDFSTNLSNWTVKDPDGLGSWSIPGGELLGDYNIGCGSSTCHQTQLLLNDVLQPGSGNWRMEAQARVVEAYSGVFANTAKFVLWVSDTEKETFEIGHSWSGSAPATSTDLSKSHQAYPWTDIARASTTVPQWIPDAWQTAVLEKRGDTYTLYWNGTQFYQVTRTFSSAPKIGFSTYGKVRMDNFKLYRLP